MAKKRPKSKTAKHLTGPKTPAVVDKVEDVIAAALSSAPPPVLMKVCRLCETKDGPFLNIFDSDKVTARKIEELMPFGIAENDDLPHKICFRCSAKVEELHEFIQKCIKTQENLRYAMGKQGPLTMKSRSCVLWEQQLNKTKLTNEDICDVLIKRAMEGIPLNAPLNNVVVDEKQAPITLKPKEPPAVAKKNTSSESESDDDDDDDYAGNISLSQVKLSFEKKDEDYTNTRTSRTTPKDQTEGLHDGLEPLTRSKRTKTYNRILQNKSPAPIETKQPEPQKLKPSSSSPVVENKKETVTEKPKEDPPPPKPAEKTDPPFNIMDHVCTIKVNKVGILFQCKLCKRNFLKKDIVMSHGCAKNRAPPKETNPPSAPIPGPPKPPTVKYIKMDKDFKKPLSAVVNKTVENLIETQPAKPVEPEVKPKPKPKVGPASKVSRNLEAKEIPKEPTPPPKPPVITSIPSATPSVTFPVTPSLSSRYKLVPGPNNTFQLVEESTMPEEKPLEARLEEQSHKSKKRKASESSSSKSGVSKHHKEKSSSPEIIDLDENEPQRPEPYPVGLFQPVPHHSSIYPPSHPPVPFTTPAMKKQSYTIVQTGNPSKLLISTKPQPVPEEPAKKKSKKKIEGKEKEPSKAPLEDAPAKDPGFFTFVSLDPLLQPSYVLPTDNIIQESQITTSTPGAKPPVEKEKNMYPCNMCGETFSREKKLLTHIQSHYNQMDKEDELRTGKPGPKRRTRKS